MITVSYVVNVKSSQHKIAEIDEIIDEIRGNNLKALVSQIATASRPAELKLQLPAFFPTLRLVTADSTKMDSASQPTGVVQFDVDRKDNRELDFEKFKLEISDLPETLFAFTSPSGGLKFGILTDFTKGPDDNETSLKHRFQQAYDIAKAHVIKNTGLRVQFDDATRSLRQACYLSWDPGAYFNQNYKSLELNHQCSYSPPNIVKTQNQLECEQPLVEELLSFIPKDLNYNERLPINSAVLNAIGTAGSSLLEQHWEVEDRVKLRKQLKDQYSGRSKFNIGVLINAAKRNGYEVPTARQRSNLKAKPSKYEFAELHTPEAGTEKLNQIVKNFFENPRDTFVNFSAGAGKTEAILRYLPTIPFQMWGLYLVKSHKLAVEISQRFEGPIERHNDLHFRTSMIHIKGREHTCEMPEFVKNYKGSGVNFPWEQCTQACQYQGNCNYTKQFSGLANIRVMTHNELVNVPPTYFYGTDAQGHPNRGNKLPDFIIIDEDWLMSEPFRESGSSKFKSISNVIYDLRNGLDLGGVIDKHRDLIIEDFTRSKQKPKRVKFTNADDYINQTKRSKSEFTESPILNALHGFLIDEEGNPHLWFDEKKNELCLTMFKEIAERYRDVPKLFLDASANELVVKSRLPDVDYHSIQIKQNDDINIYQLQNTTISKGWLKKPKNRNFLIRKIKDMTGQYENIGLISYKNIKGVSDNFTALLAEKLGIDTYNHFGNLRGSDEFKDVDCLLIVGRHFLPTTETENLTRGLFGDVGFDQSYADVPVRMKDGSSMSLNNTIYTDDRAEAVRNHFSTSETIQAIGRGRLIYGCKKDVYVFSNESLGTQVEISGFFSVSPSLEEPIMRLKEQGFCENKLGPLMEIGFTQNAIKTKRKEIESMIQCSGIKSETLEVIDRHHNKSKKRFFVSGGDKLDSYLKKKNFRVLNP